MAKSEIEEVTMFKTPDGQIFETYADAEGAFAKDDFRQIVEGHFFEDMLADETKASDGSPLYQVRAKDIVDFVTERQSVVVAFLQKLGKVNGKG